tara:strand:+ start:4599 stop:5231 length:633 start_codon:yes stop_codon:yes gene_type:complete
MVQRNVQSIYKETWNIPHSTRGNCYVFGLAPLMGPGGFYRKRTQKARPGDKCPKWEKQPYNFKNCKQTIQRVLCDNPKYVQKVPHEQYVNKNIGNNHHLMAALLSPSFPNEDFHFLRRVHIRVIIQHWERFKRSMTKKCVAQLLELRPTYVWVHQQGWSTGLKLHDASGNLIVDPSKSNFNYKGLNYSIYCGLFKVKTRYATVTTKYDIL